jgi:cupin 2 domain-containing protein
MLHRHVISSNNFRLSSLSGEWYIQPMKQGYFARTGPGMQPAIDNIFAGLPSAAAGEVFETIAGAADVRIERIVSHGQATPEGEWYDQQLDEWVILLSGSAGILFEGETEPCRLVSGDHLLIPAGCRHRVDWTAAECDTVWLAVHFPSADTQ